MCVAGIRASGWCVVVVLGCYACGQKTDATVFDLVDQDYSGIHFQNTLTPSDTFNILDYMYFYNGGGVAVGDIDKDGLEDIYFTGNQVSGKLYLNTGDLRFEDITERAGLATTSWATGATMVDVNADGWLDIYVSVAGHPDASRRQNLLFVNQGNLTFSEQARVYQLNDTGYTTHSAFFDYDRDGDLDVYLLNHKQQFYGPNNPLPKKLKGESESTDRLLRNTWDAELGHPVFEDVSSEAGILIEGFGLGVTIADINLDGWPDIYVSNDFVSNDILYINQKDGTFSNAIGKLLHHQTHNGMGNDVADVNNDALPDIVVADMLPETNARRKLMMMNTGYDLFTITQRMGYEPQYVRNTLQLNNGFDRTGQLLSFSEIGQYSGIHSTDWSWSTLFADFDQDGFNDLLVTNGHSRDLTDLDFIVYRKHHSSFTTQFQKDSLYLALLDQMPAVRLPNYLYRNTGDDQFENVAASWGLDAPSCSNGAAYADLDDDGDLDIVINNVDLPAFLYENNTVDRNGPGANWLKIRLSGPSGNSFGLGAKVWAYTDGQTCYRESSPVRGYLSSVSYTLHFGLGEAAQVDSLEVLWPDQKSQRLLDVPVNQTISLRHQDAEALPKHQVVHHQAPLFHKPVQAPVAYLHTELEHADFQLEPLIPQSYANLGPALAVGDIDGNGLEDLCIGGSAGFPMVMYYQESTGGFHKHVYPSDEAYEDMGMLLFDREGDGDLDLYVVSGGSEYWAQSDMFQDRLYVNNGSGQFHRDTAALPAITTSGSVVSAADFDRDGDLDLYVGGCVVPGAYAKTPKSALLQNDQGTFSDVTRKLAPALEYSGMVRAALWTDFDNDADQDLIVVGEWMPISLFKNSDGKLENISVSAGLELSNGWWNSIAGADFDLDGDIDYVAGNLGWNSDLKASAGQPVRVYAGYLDDNKSWDAILTRYITGPNNSLREYPVPGRDQLIDQMQTLSKVFQNYESYARAGIDDILSADQIEKAEIKAAYTFSSSYIENQGDGTFTVSALPAKVQYAPIFGIMAGCLDQDPFPDLLCVGNFFGANVETGRYDAFQGAFLKGDGHGRFEPTKSSESGFLVGGDARALVMMYAGDKSLYYASVNSDSLQVYTSAGAPARRIYHPGPLESAIELSYPDEKKQKIEFYYGSGYLSQSSRGILLSSDAVITNQYTTHDAQ